MEKLMVCWLLFAGLNVALAGDVPKYFMEGGKLTLDLGPSGPITYILWKYNGNLLGEWVKDKVDLTFYSSFVGRTTLDTNTGRLEISGMTKDDVGVYSVEINNKLQPDQYKAVLIKSVPKPEVWITPLTCASNSERCTAACEGNTTDAGPVTYSWKMGDGEWKVLEKNIDFTKADTAKVKTFTCRVKNPLTELESEAKDNPLFGEDVSGLDNGGIAGIIIFVLIAVAAAGVGTVAWCKKIGPFKNRSSTSPDSTAENGNVTALKITETSGKATAAEERQPLKGNPGVDTAGDNGQSGKENPGVDTAAEERQPLKGNPGVDTAGDNGQSGKENPGVDTAAEETQPLKENPGKDTAGENGQSGKDTPGEATAAETAPLNSPAAPSAGEEQIP